MCEQRSMFYVLEQVVSAIPVSCQEIAKLNENASTKMISQK